MSGRTAARARVASVAMQKGGVGKTTSILNLGRAAALRGLAVLVIDLDPQGNTTTSLALDDIAPRQLTIADALLPDDESPAPLRDVIVPTIWSTVATADPASNGSVSLAPAVQNPLLKAEKLITVSEHGREQRLRVALRPVLDDYDLVLVDNAPSLGLLLLNALVASNEVFAVVEADEWSADGLAELRKTVNLAREYYNENLRWSGVLISRWRNTKSEEHWLQVIEDKFGEAEVWSQDKIPLWSSIKTTLSSGKGLDESNEARLRVLGRSYRRVVAHWVDDEEVTV